MTSIRRIGRRLSPIASYVRVCSSLGLRSPPTWLSRGMNTRRSDSHRRGGALRRLGWLSATTTLSARHRHASVYDPFVGSGTALIALPSGPVGRSLMPSAPNARNVATARRKGVIPLPAVPLILRRSCESAPDRRSRAATKTSNSCSLANRSWSIGFATEIFWWHVPTAPGRAIARAPGPQRDVTGASRVLTCVQ